MVNRYAFLGAAVGTLLEYYDYALFAIFLPILAPVFFPGGSHYDALVKGFVVLCIATLARPLGGLCFGMIGDRFGRRTALLWSIGGMGITSLAMGFIPSYALIGLTAPILLTVCKTLQVFCFAGEYNGAGVYIVEQANTRPALWGSLLTATALCGSLLATSIGVVITLPHMPQGAWRIAFILGGLIALAGLFYRRYFHESPQFIKATPKQYPLSTIFKRYPRGLIAGFFIGGMATVPFITVITFINPVLLAEHHFTSNNLMLLQTGLMALCIITLVASGYIADRFSPRTVMRVGGIVLAAIALPALLMVEQGYLIAIIAGEACLLIANEILLGPSNAYLTLAFDAPYRYRATSLSFALGMSVLGGVTPLIEHLLYTHTQHFASIAAWLVLVGLATTVSIHLNKPKTANAPALLTELLRQQKDASSAQITPQTIIAPPRTHLCYALHPSVNDTQHTQTNVPYHTKR